MTESADESENRLHEMIDASDRATDNARADYLDTPEGAVERQAEIDADEQELLAMTTAYFEGLPAGPPPTDDQRRVWAQASAANQIHDAAQMKMKPRVPIECGPDELRVRVDLRPVRFTDERDQALVQMHWPDPSSSWWSRILRWSRGVGRRVGKC